MAALTLTASNQILNALTGQAATMPTGALKVALVTSLGSIDTPGTEVSGGSYARATLTFAPATDRTCSNANDIVIDGMPSVTVVGIEIWDSATTPVRWWMGALPAPKTPDAGDQLRFPAGDINLTVS
ncbi:phage tail fiber protein [Streptomyces sp. NPDC001054]